MPPRCHAAAKLTPEHPGAWYSPLSRGDCTKCLQEHVLGWSRAADVDGASASLFECCACHDAFDDEDE